MRLLAALLVLVACNTKSDPPKLLADFELDGNKLALLLEGTQRTRFSSDVTQSSTLRDFKKRWVLVVKDRATKAAVREALVVDLGADSLQRPWFVRWGDRLLVHDTRALSLFDLPTATLVAKENDLLVKQAVFTPPFVLHDRKLDTAGALIVRDRRGEWWRVATDFSVKKTSEGAVEAEWREQENEETIGCHSKIWWSFGGGNERMMVFNMTHPRQYGVDKSDETYLLPRLLADRKRHCALDGPKGPLVFTPDTLAKDSPFLLAYADGKTSKHYWLTPLTEKCGAKGLPIFASTTATDVIFAFASGAVCSVALADGAVTWTKTLRELSPQATALASVKHDGDGLAVWLRLDGTAMERVSLARNGTLGDRIGF